MSEWVNWSETFRAPVAEVRRPGTLAQLQEAVRSVHVDEGRVHAEGSRWAFSAPAYCEDTVVDTTCLCGFPKELQEAIPKPLSPDGTRLLVAVEAGIKVRDLYTALAFDHDRPHFRACMPHTPERPHLPREARDGRIWTLPVLGGAGGQSLAGVISTGTHGGDAARPPLSDAVRAMVLVVGGGQLLVLEPDDGRDRVVMVDRLADLLGQRVEVRRDTAVFDAALTSVGRFGVVWAYVIEVHDETNVAVVETRTRHTWERIRSSLTADAARAAAEDQFLQVVINPYRDAGGQHDCYVTRHTLEPGHPTDPSQAPELPFVRDARGLSGVAAVFQALGSPAVHGLLTALPLVVGRLSAEAPHVVVYAFERLGRLGSARADGSRYLVGDALADIIEFINSYTVGLDWVLPELTGFMLGLEQRDTLAGGLSGPWKVKGTRFEIADFYDYGEDPRDPTAPPAPPSYRGDSVELFFPVNPARPGELPDAVDAILRVFDVLRAERRAIAAYVSLRFMARSRATLGLARWPLTCSAEIAMLRGLQGNTMALRLLQEVCTARRGRVHWGQQHDLEARQVAEAFGPRLTQWRDALASVHGTDMLFSTPFTRRRGLEVLDPPDWGSWHDLDDVGNGDPALPSGFDTRGALLVFARDRHDSVRSRRIGASGSPEGPWTTVRPEPAAGPLCVFRGVSGRHELFVVHDSWLRHTHQETAGGSTWSGWDVKGFPAPIRYDDEVADLAVTAHGDGRIETFARASRVDDLRLAHCWANGVDGWGWSTVWHRGRGAIGAAPGACRRPLPRGRDHLLVASITTDGHVVTMHQVSDADDADWTDWNPVGPLDASGARARGDVLAVATARGRAHLLTTGPRDHVYVTVDSGSGLEPVWSPWNELDTEVDTGARLAVTTAGERIWVAARSLRGTVVCWDFVPGTSVGAARFLGGPAIGRVALGRMPGTESVYLAARDEHGRLRGRRVDPSP